MCVQCMAGAMTAGAGATGARAWLAARGFAWLTPRRLKAATATLLAAALVGSSQLSGGTPPPRRPDRAPAAAGQGRPYVAAPARTRSAPIRVSAAR